MAFISAFGLDFPEMWNLLKELHMTAISPKGCGENAKSCSQEVCIKFHEPELSHIYIQTTPWRILEIVIFRHIYTAVSFFPVTMIHRQKQFWGEKGLLWVHSYGPLWGGGVPASGTRHIASITVKPERLAIANTQLLPPPNAVLDSLSRQQSNP